MDDLNALVPDSVALDPTGGGPLDPVDVVVKDLFAVAGHTSSFGSAAWRDSHRPAATTCPTVERLLAAGARIVGLSKMDQLAYSLVGNVGEGEPPRNPRFPELWCGGSSSGSAAAVAGSRVQLGVGTDTAGSVRVPAAMCGIHGLRPTWGALDTNGVIPLAPTFDTVGLLAANPSVLRAGFEVLAGGPRPAPPLTRVLRADPILDDFPAALRDAYDDAVRAVARALGATVAEADLGALVSPDVTALFARLQGREVWRTHGDWVSRRLDELDSEVAGRLRSCADWAAESPVEVEVDEADRRHYRRLLGEIVTPGAVLVLPVLGPRAPRRVDPPEELVAFRRRCFGLQAPASLGGFPQLTWSRPPRPGEGPESTSVGLLTAPGGDTSLVDLLAELVVTR